MRAALNVAETALRGLISTLERESHSPAAPSTVPRIANERRLVVASDSCELCGPRPQECPTVLCVPCALVTANHADLVEPATGYESWSVKRLAWAFGCARKDSDLEIALYRALKAKIGGMRP